MWSSTYPFGVYGVAASQFAIDFDSTAFKVITTIVLLLLVIYWLYLVACTLPMVASGELFLRDVFEEMEKEKKHGGEKQGGGEGEREERGEHGEEQEETARPSRRHRRSSDTAV
mgnify:CR=1 FL=1|jgi:hypothetical protein